MRHDREGRAEVVKAEWDHKGGALISLNNICLTIDMRLLEILIFIFLGFYLLFCLK